MVRNSWELRLIAVLYSEGERCWKLADFGTTTEATSKSLNTTRCRRGTACYRAPEILGESASFNNKADIWALGCVVYELCSGQRAFSSDWSVMQYSLTSELKPPLSIERKDGIDPAWRDYCLRMLQLDPSK